jgi:hypothetical protein
MAIIGIKRPLEFLIGFGVNWQEAFMLSLMTAMKGTFSRKVVGTVINHLPSKSSKSMISREATAPGALSIGDFARYASKKAFPFSLDAT